MSDFKNHKKNVQTILLELQELIEKLQVMEEEILNQEEALYVISEFAYDWEYWQAVDGSYKYVSPSCETITGFKPEDFYNDSDLLEKIIVVKDWQKWQIHKHTKNSNNELDPIEFEIRTRDGQTKWIHHVCRPVTNGNGDNIGIRGSNRDITEMKELQQRLEHVAGHDSLTGLANRSLLMEHLEQRLKEAKRHNAKFAVAFMDLDGFKEINDTLGHDAGDHVLRKVAHDLQQNLRENDIISRFGGDEFVGLFSISEPQDAAGLKEKILKQLSRKIHCSTFRIDIRLSIGMSLYPQDGHDVDTLLNQADNEMYAMKAKNKAARA